MERPYVIERHKSYTPKPESCLSSPIAPSGFLIGDQTMPKKLDIVYILKEDLDTDELRYSLRSVDENFPHRKVVFVGGQPKGFKPDIALPHKQTGHNKWEQIRSSMWKVLETDDITDDFFLFNDDFFVMKPFKGKFVNFSDGTLIRRIEELVADCHGYNSYAKTLLKAYEELKSLGVPQINYDLHTPMLINKDMARTSIGQCASPQMRSIYGNINRIPFVEHPDAKVYGLDTVPKCPDFLSTDDDSFEKGKVGEYIRATFTKPSRFEV